MKSFRGVEIGMTRTAVEAILGLPTDWNTGSRKHPRPTVFKYGDDVEFYFLGPNETDTLWLVYEERDGEPHTILKLNEPAEK